MNLEHIPLLAVSPAPQVVPPQPEVQAQPNVPRQTQAADLASVSVWNAFSLFGSAGVHYLGKDDLSIQVGSQSVPSLPQRARAASPSVSLIQVPGQAQAVSILPQALSSLGIQVEPLAQERRIQMEAERLVNSQNDTHHGTISMFGSGFGHRIAQEDPHQARNAVVDTMIAQNPTLTSVTAHQGLKILVHSVKKNKNQRSKVCGICTDDFAITEQGDPAGIANCSHWFHMGCLEKWLKLKTNCPVCRKDVDEVLWANQPEPKVEQYPDMFQPGDEVFRPTPQKPTRGGYDEQDSNEKQRLLSREDRSLTSPQDGHRLFLRSDQRNLGQSLLNDPKQPKNYHRRY